MNARSGCYFGRLRLVAFPLALAAAGASSAAPRHKEKIAPVPMAPLPPAVIDNALAIGGDDIDARKVSTRMTVAVNVNGKGPYRFVVDSGADTSVVSVRTARLLQLPPGTPVLLNGMTETARVDRVLVDQLQLGPSTIRDLQLPVLQENDLGGDGMLGIDALVQQRLMMDFEKRLIKVEDASVPAPRLPDEIVVIARRQRGQLILTQVTANGKAVDAVIDTGSEITIGNLALRDKLVGNHFEKLTTIAVTGVTGTTVSLQLARIAELKLGSITLRDVPMAFADVPPFTVFGLSKEPSLLLGTDILETFRRISLDFRARKVRFQLRRCGATGIVLNTSPLPTLTRLSSGQTSETCRR